MMPGMPSDASVGPFAAVDGWLGAATGGRDGAGVDVVGGDVGGGVEPGNGRGTGVPCASTAAPSDAQSTLKAANRRVRST